jgi:carbonic anhydrase
MRAVVAIAVVSAVVVAVAASPPAAADAPPAGEPADQALAALLAGNRAFVAGGGRCARQSPARRAEVVTGQHPRAVIVGCADSRVPPEALFAQGIGDLFVVRVAGNVVDEDALGSIEYAVEHLGVRLVVVLGHSRCGAVEAALSSATPEGHVAAVVGKIRAAVASAAPSGTAAVGGTPSAEALDAAVRANVAGQVRAVRTSKPVLAPLVDRAQVRVVGARYDLESGAVALTTP